ncbi:hypothetical protein PR048_017325, partial [Dryococelus australis]
MQARTCAELEHHLNVLRSTMGHNGHYADIAQPFRARDGERVLQAPLSGTVHFIIRAVEAGIR